MRKQRGLSGNAIDFYVHVLGVSFADALRERLAP